MKLKTFLHDETDKYTILARLVHASSLGDDYVENLRARIDRVEEILVCLLDILTEDQLIELARKLGYTLEKDE